jgi:hypothetical protein
MLLEQLGLASDAAKLLEPGLDSEQNCLTEDKSCPAEKASA